MQIYTIGHSNRAVEQLVEMLQINGIQCLVDIRSFPASRSNPQFNGFAEDPRLPELLTTKGIQYKWLGKLGGRRSKGLDPSPNQGWELPAFRNYADHMLGDGFKQGIAELLGIAGSLKTAYMCSEAVPWRCHRGLVSDYLESNGHEVFHILGKKQSYRHKLTSFASIERGESCCIVTYPKVAPEEQKQNIVIDKNSID